MKKNKKLIISLILCGLLIGSNNIALLTSTINNNLNTSNKISFFSPSNNQKELNSLNFEEQKFIINSDDKFLNYIYTSDVYTNEKQLKSIGITTPEINLNEISQLPIELWNQFWENESRNAYTLSIADGFIKTKNIPNDFFGLIYIKNSNDSFFNDSFEITSSDIVVNNSGNLVLRPPTNLKFARFEGVVQLNNFYDTKLNPNFDPENLFAVNLNEEVSGKNNFFLVKHLAYKTAKSLEINDKEIKNIKRSSLTFGVFDNQIWLSNKQSNAQIRIKESVNTKNLTVQEFSKNLLNYIEIDLENTPKQCISSSNNEVNSSINIKYNSTNGNLEISFTSNKSFTPNFEKDANKNIKDGNWIKNKPMTANIEINVKNFKNGNEFIFGSTSLVENYIDASYDYQVQNSFASDFVKNESNTKIKEILLENIFSIFINMPLDISLDNLIIKEITSNDVYRLVNVKFTLNKFYNEQKELISNKESNIFEVNIMGFKQSTKTTTFDINLIKKYIDISSVSSIHFVEDITNEIINTEPFKLAIISKIINYVGSPPTLKDVININLKRINTIERTAEISVTINGEKAKINDEIQTKPYTITGIFGGFKVHHPTKQIKTLISVEKDKDLSSQLPSWFYNGNIDNNKLQTLIFNNSNLLFDSLPINFSQDSIYIKEVNLNDEQGKINLEVKLKNYFNSKGDEINTSNEKEYSDIYSLEIIDFKKSSEITNIASTILGWTFMSIGFVAILAVIVLNLNIMQKIKNKNIFRRL